MSCTEAEAKTRWCPFARVLATQKLPNGDTLHIAGHASFNRLAMIGNAPTFEMSVPQTTTCIASTCMAWQWVTPEYQCLDSMPDEPKEWYLPVNGWNKVGNGERCPSCMRKPKLDHHWRKNEPRSGLCGLASK